MPRPKEFNPDDAIEKAMHVFWHKGYEATSMEDLLTAMDLNRGSLYDTFGDKRQLFLKVMDRYCTTFAGSKFSLLDQPGPALPTLRRFISGMIEGGSGRSAAPRLPHRQHGYGAVAAQERDRGHAPPGPKDG